MEGIAKAVRVCRNGHVKKQGYDPQIETDVAKDVLKDVMNDVTVGNPFCETCGEEVIWCCENCGWTIVAESQEDTISRDDLPRYCRTCGTAFPWIDPIEKSEKREGSFLDIDAKEVNGQFYPSLIYEINICYRVKANEAVVVLLRKLVENLLLDIIRGHFGIERNEMFYQPERRQHKSLGDLIDVFDRNRSEFDQYSTAEEEEIVEIIKEVKYSGDASAHSIEERIDEEELESLSKNASYLVKVLFRLRKEVETAHRTEE